METKSKKIGIVVTDGVGYRNFILSNFLKEAAAAFSEIVILSYLPADVYTTLPAGVRVIEMPAFTENFMVWFFRKAREVAHLQRHRKGNYGMQDNFLIGQTSSHSPRGIATRLIYRLTGFLHSENWIQRFGRLQFLASRRSSIAKNYRELLRTEAFDLLFFTHQRPPYIAPLARYAAAQHIATAAFIFSWDNLASKGRMAAEFDYFLVWSDLMKRELLAFYPKVRSEAVLVVGTPQFEPYIMEEYAMSHKAFLNRFQLDPSKKTLCFSCGDISTSKNDELYIKTLADALSRGDIPELNFLVRTSPAEDSLRFAGMKAAYPWINWNYPHWELSRKGHQEEWSQRIPSVDDVKDLRALLEFSDLNVNMLSTMSLDFMLFGKPVVNPVFGNSDNGLYDDQRFLQYGHLLPVVESGASSIVRNAAELVLAVNRYLNEPAKDAEARQKLVQLEVGKPLEGTGARIVAALSAFTATP